MTSGLRTAILDQTAPPLTLDRPQYPDLRVSTITPANIRVLQQAGAWQDLAPPASAAFRRIQVWDHAGSGSIVWDAADAGLDTMGVVVENRLLQAALLRSALNAPGSGVELICPAAIRELQLPPAAAGAWPVGGGAAGVGAAPAAGGAAGGGGGSESDASTATSNQLARVVLADGRQLGARLVVGADGARSAVRGAAGLRTYGWSYEQRGVVATVATDVAAHGTGWQRFLATGPLALLPVRDGYSSVVWSTTPAMARRLEGMCSAEFADAVNEALRGGSQPSGSTLPPLPAPLAAALSSLLPDPTLLAGGSHQPEPPPLVQGYVGASPRSFPLQLRHSRRYVRQRAALVGDAAHAVHPLAGQGVNLGLGDAAALADALAAAVEVGQDLGDAGMLRRGYEAPRQRSNAAMMAALDGLQRVFAVNSGPLGAARSAGLGLLNAAPPLKNSIMRFAMGV